jgi:hypothetical protein
MCFSSGGGLGGIIEPLTGALLGVTPAQLAADEEKKSTSTKEHLKDEKVRRSRMAGDGAETAGAVSLAGLPLGRTKLGR